MSTMSASSPPAGLMPLSLIAEHKSTVPPAVQPLPRTEKCPQVQQQPQPLAGKPAVANGMEATSAPIPMVIQHPSGAVSQQVPEIAHPVTAMETAAPPQLPTPPTHQPNLPCGGKGDTNNSHPEFPNSIKENTSAGEESVAEAPVHELGSQLPTSACVAVPFPPAPPVEPPLPVVAPAPAAEIPAAEVKEVEKSPVAALAVQEVGVVDAAEPPPKDIAKTSSPQPVPQAQPQEAIAPSVPAVPTPVQQAPAAPAVPSVVAVEPVAASEQNEVATAEPQSDAKVSPTPRPKRPRVLKDPKVKKESKDPKEIPSPSDSSDDKKPKRKRLPTQVYQSPIPELNIIAKINKIDKTPQKPQEEKLIAFYRNEFLAVRNADGGFYICQAMQNIYKSSSKIKIRWLSQETNGEMYSPDFYDQTDFDCILTNLSLDRVGKNKFKLPVKELERTQSILKRAIDVEKGVATWEESPVTEEHPDGLDLSLFRNEDQLKKVKRARKGKKRSVKRTSVKIEEQVVERQSRRVIKRKPKVTKSDVVKKIAGRNVIMLKKREPLSSQTSAPIATLNKKLVRKPLPTPPPKKETVQPKKETVLPKKETAQPKKETRITSKRKANSTLLTVPIPEKKPRKEFVTKKKIIANKSKTPAATTASTSTRRNLRNSK